MTQDDSATVASVSDQDWYASRTYGVFHIPACEKGKAHSLLLVMPRGDALDLGDNRRFPFTITAREIAADLVQDLAPHGVFVCEGQRPSEEEIGAALNRRDAWYQQLVFDGDRCGRVPTTIRRFPISTGAPLWRWGWNASGPTARGK
jgi:hypothetical protein